MIIVAVGWVFLALPGALRLRIRGIHPARVARLTRGSLVAGVLLLSVGLMSMIAPTFLEGVGAHHLAALCLRLYHDVLSGGHVGGVLAAVAFAALWLRLLLASRRIRSGRRAAHLEPWVGRHHTVPGGEMVIVPSGEPLAVTNEEQVVISAGLIELLTARELDAVIRHELCHVRRRHHRYVAIAGAIQAALGWLPFVTHSLQVLRLAVERWADEEATGRNRRLRLALSSALTAAFYRRPANGLAGFADVEMVAERIQALETTHAGHAAGPSHMVATLLASGATLVGLGTAALAVVSLVFAGTCVA